MKKIFLGLALAAFVGGVSMNSFAQDGEKKAKTTKTEKKKCDKKSCCKKSTDTKKTEETKEK